MKPQPRRQLPHYHLQPELPKKHSRSSHLSRLLMLNQHTVIQTAKGTLTTKKGKGFQNASSQKAFEIMKTIMKKQDLAISPFTQNPFHQLDSQTQGSPVSSTNISGQDHNSLQKRKTLKYDLRLALSQVEEELKAMQHSPREAGDKSRTSMERRKELVDKASRTSRLFNNSRDVPLSSLGQGEFGSSQSTVNRLPVNLDPQILYFDTVTNDPMSGVTHTNLTTKRSTVPNKELRRGGTRHKQHRYKQTAKANFYSSQLRGGSVYNERDSFRTSLPDSSGLVFIEQRSPDSLLHSDRNIIEQIKTQASPQRSSLLKRDNGPYVRKQQQFLHKYEVLKNKISHKPAKVFPNAYPNPFEKKDSILSDRNAPTDHRSSVGGPDVNIVENLYDLNNRTGSMEFEMNQNMRPIITQNQFELNEKVQTFETLIDRVSGKVRPLDKLDQELLRNQCRTQYRFSDAAVKTPHRNQAHMQRHATDMSQGSPPTNLDRILQYSVAESNEENRASLASQGGSSTGIPKLGATTMFSFKKMMGHLQSDVRQINRSMKRPVEKTTPHKKPTGLLTSGHQARSMVAKKLLQEGSSVFQHPASNLSSRRQENSSLLLAAGNASNLFQNILMKRQNPSSKHTDRTGASTSNLEKQLRQISSAQQKLSRIPINSNNSMRVFNQLPKQWTREGIYSKQHRQRGGSKPLPTEGNQQEDRSLGNNTSCELPSVLPAEQSSMADQISKMKKAHNNILIKNLLSKKSFIFMKKHEQAHVSHDDFPYGKDTSDYSDQQVRVPMDTSFGDAPSQMTHSNVKLSTFADKIHRENKTAQEARGSYLQKQILSEGTFDAKGFYSDETDPPQLESPEQLARPQTQEFIQIQNEGISDVTSHNQPGKLSEESRSESKKRLPRPSGSHSRPQLQEALMQSKFQKNTPDFSPKLQASESSPAPLVSKQSVSQQKLFISKEFKDQAKGARDENIKTSISRANLRQNFDVSFKNSGSNSESKIPEAPDSEEVDKNNKKVVPALQLESRNETANFTNATSLNQSTKGSKQRFLKR